MPLRHPIHDLEQVSKLRFEESGSAILRCIEATRMVLQLVLVTTDDNARILTAGVMFDQTFRSAYARARALLFRAPAESIQENDDDTTQFDQKSDTPF